MAGKKHKRSESSHRRATGAFAEPLEDRKYFAVLTVTTPTPITFSPRTDFNAGDSPVAAAAADFDDSGNQDLAVADAGDNTVRIFLGDGTGTFTDGPVLQLSAPPTAIITGDFNGDGKPDLAVACTATTANPATSVTIFLNTGNDTFAAGQITTVESTATPSEPVALVAGNFDGDGKLDLAVTEYSQDGIAILFGDGTGGFAAPVVYTGNANPDGIVAGLFTGGSLPDLVITSTSYDPTTQIPSKSISLLENDGFGNFSVAQNIQIGSSGYTGAIAAADVTGAGAPDVVVGNADGTMSVFLNTGGQFELAASPPLPGGSSAVAVGDFNLDGIADLVSANGGSSLSSSANSVSVIAGLGQGNYTTAANSATGSQPADVVVADFNNDSRPDIATVNDSAGTVSILLNDTVIPVISTKTVLTSDHSSTPAGSAVNLTATVTPLAASTLPGESYPTGDVDFYDGTTFLGESTIDAGENTAEFSATSLAVGPHKLTAVYRGDEAYDVSTSRSITQTITPTATQGPDLIGTFVSSSFSATVVPGETGNIKIRVTNTGNALATGAIDNGLYLSLDSTLDTSDLPIALKGQLANATVHLNPNQSVVLTGTFTIPTTAPLANYYLLVWLNQTNTLAESDASDNVAASVGTYNIVDGFGTISGHSGLSLQMEDANGTLGTFKLTGPGSGTVNAGDDGIDVELTGTTSRTTISIITKAGEGPLQLHDLIADGAIGTLRAPGVMIDDMVALPGGASAIVAGTTSRGTQIILGSGPATSISLGEVSGLTLTAASGLRSLAVAGWTSTRSDSITAPWIGSLVSKGDFGAQLSLTGGGAPAGVALQSATINGNVGDSVWSIGGGLGKLKVGSILQGWSASVGGVVRSFVDSGNFAGDFAGVSFGSVTIDGNIADADILAGASFGSAGRLGDGDETFGAGSITSLHVTGAITDSIVAAGLVPSGQSLIGSGASLAGGSINAITIGGQIASDSRVLAQILAKKAKVAGAAVATAGDASFTLTILG